MRKSGEKPVLRQLDSDAAPERDRKTVLYCISDGSCWEILIKQIHTFTSNILFEQYAACERVDLLAILHP